MAGKIRGVEQLEVQVVDFLEFYKSLCVSGLNGERESADQIEERMALVKALYPNQVVHKQ